MPIPNSLHLYTEALVAKAFLNLDPRVHQGEDSSWKKCTSRRVLHFMMEEINRIRNVAPANRQELYGTRNILQSIATACNQYRNRDKEDKWLEE